MFRNIPTTFGLLLETLRNFQFKSLSSMRQKYLPNCHSEKVKSYFYLNKKVVFLNACLLLKIVCVAEWLKTLLMANVIDNLG